MLRERLSHPLRLEQLVFSRVSPYKPSWFRGRWRDKGRAKPAPLRFDRPISEHLRLPCLEAGGAGLTLGAGTRWAIWGRCQRSRYAASTRARGCRVPDATL